MADSSLGCKNYVVDNKIMPMPKDLNLKNFSVDLEFICLSNK